MRNVTSLHQLLDDVTSLARLQAGREVRHSEPTDITMIMQQLCEGIRPLAQQRGLFLRCEGPPGLAVDADSVKVRRIAQNLILNAVKYTREGGITVRWGDSAANDPKRWELCIVDKVISPLPDLGAETKSDETLVAETQSQPAVGIQQRTLSPEEPGEGIGLSIVKRLCTMLDATIELKSESNVGTTFRVLFPRHYAN
jgi:signal transduction histidine kinase